MTTRDGCHVVPIWYSGIDAILRHVDNIKNNGNSLSGARQAGIVSYALDDPVHSMAARDGCCVVLVWYSGIDAILVHVEDPQNLLTRYNNNILSGV